MLVWLGCCAVLAFVAATFSFLFAAAPAPSLHWAFAAGAMPLVFGATIHFIPVLTRTAAPLRAIYLLPLPVQAAGILVALGLAGWLPITALHAAAGIASIAALVLVVWITRRLRATLGAPHPGARWYGAAMLCLFLAVSLVPIWLTLPELRPALRLFHLHLNTLGFIGLAALGTLPVLLPTVAGKPEPKAVVRLRTQLLPASGGALLVAAGAAVWPVLAVPGALLLAWLALSNLLAWQRTYGGKLGAGAAAPLVAATAGFVLLMLMGIAHGLGMIAGRPALLAYLALFLLPLVIGALAALLPVWRYPGRVSPLRQAVAARLGRGGRLRAALFFSGGVLLAFEQASGLLFLVAGLASFMMVLVRALSLDSSESSDDNRRPIP